MEIRKIKKRDGKVVDFEKDKLRIAMEKAAKAVNPEADLRRFDMISDHALRHIEIKFPSSIPDVESVQDLVERSLMEFGLFDVAKAYILYRAEHALLRDKEKKQIAIKPEKTKLSYLDENGQSKLLDRKKLRQWFSEASEGYEEVINLDALVEHAESNVYEGISYTELGKALVLTTRAFIEKDPAYSKVTARLALNNLYFETSGTTDKKQFEKTYRETFKSNLKKLVEGNRLDPRILEFDLDDLAAYIDTSRDNNFEFLGLQVLYDRYFLRNEGGKERLESAQGFWMRIAMGLALEEGKDKEKWAKKFYDVMSKLLYVPSTPTNLHAGTTYPQLSSCYLNTVEDDLYHIFQTYSDNAQLSKYSGGIGTDWTNIRATGALIKSTNLESQGVIPFLRIMNDVNIAINRSGKRRGAACAYLETWHYEIEDFLDLRRNTGDERRRTHDINTANWIPDLFMKRVAESGKWTLFSPEEVPELHHIYGKKFEKRYKEYEKQAAEGKIRLYKTIEAKDLWRKMITMLFETGHPWITFKDPCNVRSPQDHVGVIHNSNLCTEITLNNSKEETAVCNLGSINMGRHIKNGKLDTVLLKDTIHVAMRMLDNVVDLTYYPTKETKFSNLQHRPVGLGLQGFQDALYLLDLDFDSEKAVKFADESMEFISYHAILASSTLAKEKGTYDTFKGSKWDRGIFPIDTLDLLEAERGMPIGVSRSSKMDWSPVRESVKKYGMRNSNTMAIAPTATNANINGCYPCIEPIYKNLYVKSNMSGEFTVVNNYLVEDLKRLGLWNETMLDELKRTDGSVQDITSIPPRLRNKYRTVFEIDTHQLVKLAAYRGKWIDQSQSFNVFFKGTSGRLLSDVYMLAWHMGLKTTYYLRTMAASSVEKSTVGLQNQWATPVQVPEISPESLILASPLHIEETFTQVQAVFSEVDVNTLSEGKACLIDDPTCEACQ